MNEQYINERLDAQQLQHQRVGIWIAFVFCFVATIGYTTKGFYIAAAAEATAAILAGLAFFAMTPERRLLREFLLIAAIVLLTMDEPLLLGGMANPATAVSMAKMPVLYMALFGYERFWAGMSLLAVSVGVVVLTDQWGLSGVVPAEAGADSIRQLAGVIMGLIMMANRERLRIELMGQINSELAASNLDLQTRQQQIDSLVGDLETQNRDRQAKAAELAKSNAKLEERAQKQQSMFGIIAHELRTPAAALDMGLKEAKWLSEDASLPAESVRELQSSSNHLLSVIDDLRVSINPEQAVELHPRPFQLDEMKGEILRQVSPIFGKSGMKVFLDWDAAPERKYFADAYRLRSVLTNLLRNAAYHSEGRRAWLSLSWQPANETTDLVTFQVEDDGVGIPEEAVDALFEPFERGTTKSKGTGVGLHIVRTWTSMLGGEVRFRPSERGGACFEINVELPRYDSQVSDTAPESRAEVIGEFIRNKRVLLVEDDRVLRSLTAKLLRRELGVLCETAADGKEALATFEGGEFDLVITDYFMPGMNGLQFIQQLRAQLQFVPVIACTAATIGEEQQELVDAGADHVIPKPIDLDKVREALGQLLKDGRLQA